MIRTPDLRGVALTLLLGWLCLLAPLAAAADDHRHTVDLAAQPLADALVELGETMALTIVAPDELVANQRAAPLQGAYTAQQALDQLLRDTGLQARESASGAWIVSKLEPLPDDAGSAPETETQPPLQRIEEIVVQGEKVDRSLQDTIASVAVLPGTILDESYITDVGEILQRIPNVSTNGGNGLAIRGIPERGLGTGTGDTSQTSAIYVDGAVQSQAGASNGLLSTWDVGQVEVFRGPQTTTQGRAALGGAVIVNTVDPSFEWNGRARIAYGDFETRQYAAAFGGPLIDDVLAFRLSGDRNESDGFTTVITDNGDVFDDASRSFRDQYRGKLRYAPTDRLEFLLTFTTSEAEDSPAGINVPPDPSEFTRFGSVDISRTEVDSYVLDVDYEIGPALAFTSVTAYTELDLTVRPREETLGVVDRPLNVDARDEQFTQEFRLNFDGGGRWRGVAGLYYSDIQEDSVGTFSGEVLGGITIVVNQAYANSFENYALYGDGEFDLAENWSLLLGARWDTEDGTRREVLDNFSIPPIPQFPPTFVDFSGDSSFSELLPKLGLRHAFTDAMSLAFTVQRAYRPGGADIQPITGETVPFDPEFTTNYDLSFRSLWLDGALSLNANVFYTDYEDMQVRFAPDPEVFIIRFVANAGSAELYGLELEANWQATERLNLYGALGTLNTEFKEFLFQGDDLGGNEFPNSPSLTGSAGGTWSHESGFIVTIDTIYSDSFDSSIQNTEESVTDSYFVTNARVGYQADHFGIFAYVQNVFDEQYFFSFGVGPDGAGGTPGPPQTLGLILETSF